MSVSAAEESSDQSLPSFTTFVSDLEPPVSWGYYDHPDRINADVINSQISQNSVLRPWEMDTKDGRGFEPYPKLPSFQSQFQPFSDGQLVPDPMPAQPMPVPVSPSSASPVSSGPLTQLTQLTPSPLTTIQTGGFTHTLTGVSSFQPLQRTYPLVPAPIQARDIPTIQQSYLEERHIQLYQPITTFSQPPSVVTVLKNEPANFELNLKNGFNHFQSPVHQQMQMDNNGYATHHHMNGGNGLIGATEIKMSAPSMKSAESPTPVMPPQQRKKERRKMRAVSMESSGADSESAMDTGGNHPGQVAAVSSTANFKSPMHNLSMNDDSTQDGDKQTKKKRKRCGECVGCQRKDNCGDCAPCRNDKSHQICKQRRCEKLTEKKIIYGPDGTIIRGEGSGRGRGRGKGRGGGSGRGRKARNAVSPKSSQVPTSSISPIPAPTTTTIVPQPSPSPATQNSNQSQLNVVTSATPIVSQHQQVNQNQSIVVSSQPQQQQQQQQIISIQQNNGQHHQVNHTTSANIIQQTATITTMKDQSQQPMTPMAFYPTWQADPTQGWQNQFIQQIPQNTPTIAPLGSSLDFQPQGYAYQANSYVQTGLGFDPNYGRPTYASPVQRYDVMSNQLPLSNQVSLQSVNFAPTVTYAGQVSSGPALLLGSQNGGDSQKQLSGNDMPGYPRVSNVPQRSLNCNGYPGSEYSGSSTPNNNTTQSTSSSSSSSLAMQPPTILQSSPSRSRPNSNQQIYSPSHLNSSMQSSYSSSPSHTTTPATTGSSSVYGQQLQDNQNGQSPSNGNNASGQTEWAWNNGMSQQNEMFNQSDRVNLNTRLKTMILNKGESTDDPKHSNDQSQAQQTGHFLSYSHHLRDTTNSMNDNNTTVPEGTVDTFGRGGISETWKFGNPDFQSKPSKKHQDFEQKQQSIEKNIEDSTRRDNSTDRYSNTSSAYYGSSSSKSNNNSSNDKMQPQKTKSPNKHQSFSSKHEKVKRETFDPYDFDASRSVKQETDPARPEAFEKNYQSFIKYADFVDQQQQQQTQQTPSQDPSKLGADGQPNYYLPSYNYSGFQPYPTYSQGYTNLTPQNSYTPQETPGINQSSNSAFMATNQQSTTTATTTTNFEQQIPAHTYPKIGANTNNTTSNSSTAKSDGDLSQDSGTLTPKIEPEYSSEFSQPETCTPVNDGQSTSQSSDPENTSLTEKIDVKKEGKEETKSKKVKKETIDVAVEPPPKAKPKRVRNKKKKEDKNKDKSSEEKPIDPKPEEKKEIVETKAMKKAKDPLSIKPELPSCDCFKDEKAPPEPGSYYTHLGCAATLADLRKEIESRVGITGKQLRIEKVVYTGKEGKSNQGCPVAKWVIRRVDPEEKLLYIVKNRKGHRCKASWLVISIVVWDGVPPHEADSVYRMLIHKLNKFGLPTTRRCATNENRTCACQGLDPETCGVSYSFGCSWSMYYNGCKYARSKTVRKFRLSVKNEEAEIEERMNILATMLAPIYSMVAPKSYENQTQHERDAYDCRLGLKQGKPFSGVTCCLDFCAHTHRDLHNMQDGCTVQAILLKPRPYGMPPDDEQLHVLPMYTMDNSDEYDDEEAQKKKNETGACKLLEKFPTEVRVRSTPLQPCRRHGKKRNNGKDDEESLGDEIPEPPLPEPKVEPKKDKRSKKDKDKAPTPTPVTPTKTNSNPPSNTASMSPRAGTPNSLSNNSNSNSAFTTPPSTQQATATPPVAQQPVVNKPPGSTSLIDMASMIDNFTDAQLQSNQISSTVLDSPYAAYDYNLGTYVDTRTYYNQWPDYGYANRKPEEMPDTTTRPGSNSSNSAFSPSISEPKTPTNFTNLEDFKPGFHQTERGFVKPKPPEYHTGYGYHTAGYPNPTYPYNPYENPYNSYNYNYTQSYQPYSYTPGPMPPPGPTSVPTPPNWSLYPHANPAAAVPNPVPIMKAPEPPKETLGEVKEVNDNLDCFEETAMGGVAIALQHGSLVIECAKLEMHSTTSLKHPNRLNPTRMSLIFYQHRNLNRRAHGTAEWAEKMRLKKLGLSAGDEEMLLMDDDIKDEPLDEFDDPDAHWGGGRMSGHSSKSNKSSSIPSMAQKPMLNKVVNHTNTDIRYHHHHAHLQQGNSIPPPSSNNHHLMQQSQHQASLPPSHIPTGYSHHQPQHHTTHHLHHSSSGSGSHHHLHHGNGGSDRSTLTRTTTSWTTQFPMHPCITTGPYYDSQAAAAAMGLALDPNMPPPST